MPDKLKDIFFTDSTISLYEKTGFSRQGTLRELAYRDGKRCDIVVMDILKQEFVQKHGTLPKN